MRYLKTYKIFEGYDVEVYQTLIDICLDIRDEGFISEVKDDQRHVPRMNMSYLFIHSNERKFKLIEIKDTLNRIAGYLGNCIKEMWYISDTGDWVKMEDVNSGDELVHKFIHPNLIVYGLKIVFRTK